MSRQAPERSVSSFENFLEIEENSTIKHENLPPEIEG
jgi:hypothetical protein